MTSQVSYNPTICTAQAQRKVVMLRGSHLEECGYALHGGHHTGQVAFLSCFRHTIGRDDIHGRPHHLVDVLCVCMCESVCVVVVGGDGGARPVAAAEKGTWGHVFVLEKPVWLAWYTSPRSCVTAFLTRMSSFSLNAACTTLDRVRRAASSR